MKSMKTKLVLLLAAVMMFSVMLTGCQSKLPPADQTVKAMYDLVVKEDAAPITSALGFSSEDDAKAALLSPDYKGIADGLKEGLASSGVTFTDDEMKQLTDAVKGMMDKLTCTATIQSQTKDETTVLLKVTGYSGKDMMNVMTNILTDLQKNMDQETAKAIMSGDQDATQKMMSDMLKQYVTKLGELQPSTDTTDVTVQCKKLTVKVNGKNKVAWLPADTDKFVSDLENATLKD